MLIQKLNISDIVDNLTSTATNKPLSAKQGKTLFDTFANYYSKTQIDSFLSQKSNLPDYLSISGNLDARSYKANDVIPLSFAGLTVLSRGITVTNNKIQLVPNKHYRITCCCPYIDNSYPGLSLRIVGQGIDLFYFDPYSPTATFPSYPSSYRDWETKTQDRKSTRLNSSHRSLSRMPSSA